MKKRVFTILSVFIAAIVLVAMVPGCGPTEPDEATISVEATLCDEVYTGAMAYTLSAAGEDDQNGTIAGGSHTVAPGDWSIQVSFGPAGASVIDITPSANQTVAAGGNITFTVNFEAGQDAWCEFLTWTINGEPAESYDMFAAEPVIHTVVPGDVIDIHFKQGVKGCEGVDATLAEDANLVLYLINLLEPTPLPPVPALVHVANDDCAVNKTPLSEAPTPDKEGQTATFWTEPVPDDTVLETYMVATNLSQAVALNLTMSMVLDEHATWYLKKEVDYEKSINWLTFAFEEPQEWPSENVMFQVVVPPPGPPLYYHYFILAGYLDVVLVSDVDIKDDNNSAPPGPFPIPLGIAVTYPP